MLSPSYLLILAFQYTNYNYIYSYSLGLTHSGVTYLQMCSIQETPQKIHVEVSCEKWPIPGTLFLLRVNFRPETCPENGCVRPVTYPESGCVRPETYPGSGCVHPGTYPKSCQVHPQTMLATTLNFWVQKGSRVTQQGPRSNFQWFPACSGASNPNFGSFFPFSVFLTWTTM